MIPATPTVFLLTDFGQSDHYVAVMKAVIMGRCPAVRLVDITHDVGPQDIAEGAYLLESVWAWIPAGSVILAVVDPGVGTGREPAAFYHDEKTIIGPNNGLFGYLPRELEGRVLDRPELRLDPLSDTFHGRDIFAPCAAFIAAGGHWSLLGDKPAFPAPLPGDDDRPRIIHFDHFGNAITSIRGPLAAATDIEIPGKVRCPIVKTYADVVPGQPLAYIGSTGRLEIAIRNGNARASLSLDKSDIVTFIPPPPA